MIINEEHNFFFGVDRLLFAEEESCTLSCNKINLPAVFPEMCTELCMRSLVYIMVRVWEILQVIPCQANQDDPRLRPYQEEAGVKTLAMDFTRWTTGAKVNIPL